MAIAEPMLSFSCIPPNFWNDLCMKLVSCIVRDGLDYLWVLCDLDMNLLVEYVYDQMIV